MCNLDLAKNSARPQYVTTNSGTTTDRQTLKLEMQILPEKDRLVFISEDPTADDKDKVQSFNWVDIKTIHFIYPKDYIVLKIRNIFISVAAFLFAHADTTALFNKDVDIIIKLKNGETVEKEFTFYTIEQGKMFEKLLQNHLKSADT